MARQLAVYRGHESARMAALDGVPLASFTARFCAFFIDTTIAFVSYVVPAVLVATIAIKMGWIHRNVHITFDPFHHEDVPSILWYMIFIAASNFIGNGATIGKKLLKIRAVSLVHQRLSLWHSLERALGYGASALEAFFGFFQYFIDPNHQTVHDRIARTIVVSERRRPTPAPAAPALPAEAESAPGERVPTAPAAPAKPESPESSATAPPVS
jgi:uncharacterized RDD family membrane protein YckC